MWLNMERNEYVIIHGEEWKCCDDAIDAMLLAEGAGGI